MFTLNCKGVLHNFNQTIIMGIINTTPNSFYKNNNNQNYLATANNMLQQGATIIDVGGQSTAPNAPRITAQQEADRVLPTIEAIAKQLPNALISIDTFYSHVAAAAVHAGAHIVNDVSAGQLDAEMLPTVAQLKVPYIAMHMQGTPQNMQNNPSYNNVVADVFNFLGTTAKQCNAAGINDVIIDVGFGFGKTTTHNFDLLRNLAIFKNLGHPILAGISRKSMVYKTLNKTPETALNGTTALHMVCLQNGANILRVHDVAEANECIKLHLALHNNLK
jgi:dihydropteroate synthase